MGRSRNPNREKAFELFKEHKGKISSKDIAKLLNESEKNIEYWRSVDRWSSRYNPKGGAPLGNKNAIGAPEGNQYARKDGWYSKYLPTRTKNIIKELQESEANPIDILWAQIVTQWAAIMNAQKIMFVENKDDKTKEIKKFKSQSEIVKAKGGRSSLPPSKNFEEFKERLNSDTETVEVYREEEFEIQFAWDKQANFLNAQSRAMGELRSLIRQYEYMLTQGLVTEEQKLRIKKIKESLNNSKQDIQSRKELNNKKLQLEREKFEHQKEVDELKNF